MSRICCGTFKATLQILCIANGQLIDAATDNDQACKHFAKTKNIIDAYVQFDAAQIYIRYNSYVETMKKKKI